MKISDLVTSVQDKFDLARNWLRYNPLNTSGREEIVDSALDRGREKLEDVEIPQLNRSQPTANSVVGLVDSRDYLFEPPSNPYPQYDRCDRHNPLGCDRAQATLKTAPMAKFCSQCGFPAPLAAGKEIRGKKGVYQITGFRSRQGNGRVYQAVQQNNGREVIVKEYLLPRRYFASPVIQQKKETFPRIANFKVATTIPSDFRLIVPQEGISDDERDCCYLIAPGNLAALPSLKDYLIQQGRIEPERVIQLLEQVLQSLEFLHSHRWKFTSGEVKPGMVHGNLSLDTLLIQQTEMGFLVYLWDLAVWSELFLPQSPAREHNISDDLSALGNIGIYLLAAPEIVSQTTYPLNPNQEANWQGIEPSLRAFLSKLIGLDSPFADVLAARKALHQLKKARQKVKPAPQIPESAIATKNHNKLWLSLPLALVLLGVGIWWWRRSLVSESPVAFSGIKAIEDVSNVPSGELNYGLVANEKMDLFKIGDTYKNAFGLSGDVDSFAQIIRQKQELVLNPQLYDRRQKLLNNISPLQTNFALMNFSDRTTPGKFTRDDGEEIIANPIAYNGLLVYVAFVDCSGQCEQLGEYLTQKITLQQLRDIYMAKIDNWQQINPDIPGKIPLQAFAPPDEFALNIFAELLFEEEAEVKEFRKALATGKIQQQETYSMLQSIRNLWEQDKTGGIGFDFQGAVYKQCNVYPLSVVRDDSQFYPLLVEKNQQNVDLFKNLSCKDKQDYQLNQTVFRDRTYPLTFALNLLYLNDDRRKNLQVGQKLTEIFQTQEFQCHLSHQKLIPLKSSERDCTK